MPGVFDHLRGEVDADDAVPVLGHQQGERSGAAAQIQDSGGPPASGTGSFAIPPLAMDVLGSLHEA